MDISTAGIALRGERYLVALRRPGTSIGERWEFPGGKVEPGETPREALKREYFEEFDCPIEVGEFVGSFNFMNGDKEYTLQAFHIEILTENIVLREHQKIRWATLSELGEIDMAESDRKIIPCLLDEDSRNL